MTQRRPAGSPLGSGASAPAVAASRPPFGLLRGSIEFIRRQGGEYGLGFDIARQTDDGRRGGDFERSAKAAETKEVGGGVLRQR